MWQWAQGLAEEEWLRFLSGKISIPGHVPPPMPPEEFQQSWVGASGIVALREAAAFLHRLKKHMAEAGASLRRDTRTLDFGVGWGRFYRLLMRELDDLTGIDPDQPCIEMCREMMPDGRFMHIEPEPPYPFRSASFDLIYAYSVFTHLAEPLFHAIVAELARMLAPGGFLAFTANPMSILNHWDSMPSENLAKVLTEAGFDAEKWRRRAEAGEFLFLPTGGGSSEMTPDRYGWTLFTRAYLEKVLPTPRYLVTMEPAEGIPQIFVLLRSSSRDDTRRGRRGKGLGVPIETHPRYARGSRLWRST
jgi:SAM-dependent methyltransferase